MLLNILQDSLLGGLLDLDERTSSTRASARARGETASISSHLEASASEDGMQSAVTSIAKAERDGVEIVSTGSAAARGGTASTSTDVTAIVETEDDGSATAEGSVESEAEAERDEEDGLDFFATTATGDVQATGSDLTISREEETTEIEGDPQIVESFTVLRAIRDGAVHLEMIELPFMVADELSASILWSHE